MSMETAPNGCAIRPVISAKPRTISVNGVSIPRAAIARETQNHPADKPIDAWLAAARALVVRELLLQEAQSIGLAPEPLTDGDGRRETVEEALVRALVAQEVVTPRADEAACLQYYNHNRACFRSPDLYELRHILLAAPPADGVARLDARRRAEEIVTALRQEPTAFGAMAQAESACPSGKCGGNLGQIGPGQTVPEFEQALPSLPVGAVAPHPVESRYGFHVVAVDRRIEGRELPFEMVQARIAAWLEEKVQRVAIRQYISILAGRAEIIGISLESSASPLVQ